MKKIYVYIIIIIIIFPLKVSANEVSKLKQGSSFMDLGNYIQTFEINESEKKGNQDIKEDDTFEEEAINDLAKRYEKNAVELNLDEIDDDAITKVNNNNIYKLEVNETHYNIENKIKNENMIWDNTKGYTQSAIMSSRRTMPIPSVVNSQRLNIEVSKDLSASLGQTTLNDSLGSSVLFIRGNESKYNTGSVIKGKSDLFDISLGTFSSSYNNASSGGAMLKTKGINLPKDMGHFALGSAMYKKEEEDGDKTTGGFFGEYQYKRLKLNAQVGKSYYSNNNSPDTSLYFSPEYKLSDSLYLKTRLIKNVTQENMQDELALTYKPKNNKNNLEFEINASRQYDKNDTIKQRLKFSTSFRI